MVELLMVVLIIAISTIVFTPAISLALAQRRVSDAARDMIRVGRRARSDTFGLLRAHLLWIDPANMRLQLLRGPTNSCTLNTNWATIATDCAGSSPQNRCVEQLSIPAIAVSTGVRMYERLANGNYSAANGRALCFAPSGIVFTATGTSLGAMGALASNNSAAVNGGFVYTLVMGGGSGAPTTNDGSRLHHVLFPLGGSARSTR